MGMERRFVERAAQRASLAHHGVHLLELLLGLVGAASLMISGVRADECPEDHAEHDQEQQQSDEHRDDIRSHPDHRPNRWIAVEAAIVYASTMALIRASASGATAR